MNRIKKASMVVFWFVADMAPVMILISIILITIAFAVGWGAP